MTAEDTSAVEALLVVGNKVVAWAVAVAFDHNLLEDNLLEVGLPEGKALAADNQEGILLERDRVEVVVSLVAALGILFPYEYQKDFFLISRHLYGKAFQLRTVQMAVMLLELLVFLCPSS